MFLSEVNCCKKMLLLLKWWNSLCCVLFSSWLMFLFIVCVQQQIQYLPIIWIPSYAMEFAVVWGVCAEIRVQKRENEVNAQKQISKKKSPQKLKINAFLQLFHQRNQTVVVWPVRSFIYQLCVWSPQQFVHNRKMAEQFWLQDCSAHFLFKTCSPKREIDNVWHGVAVERFLAAELPCLQQSERFTSHQPSIEPGWHRAGAKAIFGQVAGMEPAERGGEITVPTPKCI